jgi:hypothetical protein
MTKFEIDYWQIGRPGHERRVETWPSLTALIDHLRQGAERYGYDLTQSATDEWVAANQVGRHAGFPVYGYQIRETP